MTAPLRLRDILARMIHNAEALQRLQTTTEAESLDPDRVAHLHEVLEDIATRDVRTTEALSAFQVRHHLERRVTPFERRQGPERRLTR
jgi:hypothetical protein